MRQQTVIVQDKLLEMPFILILEQDVHTGQGRAGGFLFLGLIRDRPRHVQIGV